MTTPNAASHLTFIYYLPGCPSLAYVPLHNTHHIIVVLETPAYPAAEVDPHPVPLESLRIPKDFPIFPADASKLKLHFAGYMYTNTINHHFKQEHRQCNRGAVGAMMPAVLVSDAWH